MLVKVVLADGVETHWPLELGLLGGSWIRVCNLLKECSPSPPACSPEGAGGEVWGRLAAGAGSVLAPGGQKAKALGTRGRKRGGAMLGVAVIFTQALGAYL